MRRRPTRDRRNRCTAPSLVALVAVRCDRRSAIRSATRRCSIAAGPSAGLAGLLWPFLHNRNHSRRAMILGPSGSVAKNALRLALVVALALVLGCRGASEARTAGKTHIRFSGYAGNPAETDLMK